MMTPTEPVLTGALDAAQRAADAAHNCLVHCSFNADDELSRVKATLVCTIADGLHGVVALLRSYGQGHVPTLIRSLIEALGDLDHLNGSNASIYLDRLKLTSALTMLQKASPPR